MSTNITLKTAQAAEVAGVGYEGFRSWLKRGLLKNGVMLPKLYAAHVPTEVDEAKRWRWSSFGFADLCSFRLAKVMFDAGMSWESVQPIVGDHDLWQSHHTDSPKARFLAFFPKSAVYTFYSATTLADDLERGIIKADWMTLIDLHDLRRSVRKRTCGAVLRAIADDLQRTVHISATSGPALPTPEQAAQRIDRLQRVVGELQELANRAELGEGSYEEFEALLDQMHKDGKSADDVLLSALAAAFSDPANDRQ